MIARIWRAGAALALCGAWALLGAGSGHGATVAARDGGERVASMHVDAVITDDGSLAVTEMISYDFAGERRHGIEREIGTRERFDEDRDRVYELAGVAVSSPSGAPDGLELVRSREATTIRIGDPDRTVTGRHRYELRYVLRGLMYSFGDHDELFWEATGTRWAVGLSDVSVTVHAPAALNRSACLAGAAGSAAGCGQIDRIDGRQVAFRQPSLGAGEGLTVVVGLAKGAVRVPPPVLVPAGRGQWDAPPSALSYLVAGAAVVGTAVGGGLLWLRGGRDRAYAGLPLGLAPAGGERGVEEPVPVLGAPEPAVAFTPPKGVRPALAGLLLAEHTSPLQVSATIVDLATRGYLRIDELPGEDWQLTRLGDPRPGDELARYEQALLDGLFQGGDAVVRMSDLNRRFRPRFHRVCRELAAEGQRAGWFRRRPRIGGVSGPRQLLGCLSVLVALPVSFGSVGSVLALAGAGWSAAVVAAGVLVSAVIAHLVWRAMPARTALGRAVWAQVTGFRQYLATAEADQLRAEEASSVFGRYLPLAMIFGLTERWAAVFARLAAEQGVEPAVSWYTGDPGNLGSSLDSFGRSGGDILSSSAKSAASGGSGFSAGSSVGGGSSGGGGRSW